MVEIDVVGDDGVGGEFFAGSFLPGEAESDATSGIGEELIGGADQAFEIANGDEQAAFVVGDDFGNAAGGGGHAWAGEGHGFENAETETFAF